MRTKRTKRTKRTIESLEPIMTFTENEVQASVDTAREVGRKRATISVNKRCEKALLLGRLILEKWDEITQIMADETGRYATDAWISEVANSVVLAKNGQKNT